MNAARHLIDTLQAKGIELTVSGDKLRVKAPVGTVTDDLRRTLAEHKAEIIDLLSRKPAGQVIDVRAYLLKLCQRLPMPPEHLLRHYFTADDLADIERGIWPNPYALGEFIKTDMRYPFGWSDNGGMQ